MARTQRLIRIATGLGFILLLLANGQASADVSSGVSVTVWDNNTGWNQYNASPPVPPITNIVGTFTDTDINHNFDQQPLFNLHEDFVVRYQGFITSPVATTVRFFAPADDGVQFFLNDQRIINDWYDKGGGGSVSAPIQLQAGVSQPFTLWFYENGGAAWLRLMWLIDNQWQIVPPSAFTISETTTTTTSAPPTTTEPPTTTTEASTTTTIPETQTTQNLQQQTTTTDLPVLVQTTVPVTTLPEPVPVATSLAPSTTGAPTTTQQLPTTTTTIQVPTSVILPTTTTTIVELIDTQTINAEQAAVLATDPELLQEATPEQAQAIFAALEVDELDPAEITQLINAVQNAPIEVREAFEEEVNVFGGAVDSYVPVGSTVPVSTRRLVIAAGAMLAAVPTAAASASSARRK